VPQRVQLDGTSGVATCLQLVQQVHQALRLVMLEPGDRLPTAQKVVAQLAINPNTVHKAYRELERAGLARARPGLGLIGPNGAGKTTLLCLATGMLTPTRGTITVLGQRPAAGPAQLARVGFVAQDTAVYARLTVAGHLRLGAWLNPGWDDDLARQRIGQLALDPGQWAGSPSGGQRAQLALTLTIAKRPELLILDEPIASLDPLARREFLQGLIEAVAEQRLNVVLSSHLVADLERVCDYVIVLVASQVRVAGEVTALLASHHRLSGPRRDPSSLPAGQEVGLLVALAPFSPPAARAGGACSCRRQCVAR
jgi:ABC-2 type transport system ATP-binding protein